MNRNTKGENFTCFLCDFWWAILLLLFLIIGALLYFHYKYPDVINIPTPAPTTAPTITITPTPTRIPTITLTPTQTSITAEPVLFPTPVEHVIPSNTILEQTIIVKIQDKPVFSKLDILFVFDVTSSMSDEISVAKKNSIKIMNAVREKVADTAFGVATFSDYPGSFNYKGYSGSYGSSKDYPWRLDQVINTDLKKTQNAINKILILPGDDEPESYLRALYEATRIEWRPGAKRVLVLFGDAPAHDISFYGENFGIDPGPDSKAGTSDDLTLIETVKEVARKSIEIIPIDSSTRTYVTDGFKYIANQTGGEVFDINRADEVTKKVTLGLQEAATIISQLKLIPSFDTPSWISIMPPLFKEVKTGETREFKMRANISPGIPSKIYEFKLLGNADGIPFGEMPVKIKIP